MCTLLFNGLQINALLHQCRHMARYTLANQSVYASEVLDNIIPLNYFSKCVEISNKAPIVNY